MWTLPEISLVKFPVVKSGSSTQQTHTHADVEVTFYKVCVCVCVCVDDVQPYFTCWVTQSSYVIFLLFIPVLRCIRHTYFAHQPEVDEVRSVTLTDQRMLVRIIFFTVLAFSSRCQPVVLVAYNR